MSNISDEIIQQSEKGLLHVYNRFPVVFDHGKGVNLYDVDGKEYLDFFSGIGVNAYGYGDKEYEDAICAQARKLLHISNLYYHTDLAKATDLVIEATGMDRVFFTNSGAEAIEGALKAAKKYAYKRNGTPGGEIIAMQHSFHGRTVGAVSVTGNDHYREPFYPLMDGVRFATFNDIESVKAQLTDKTCAILVEPVQGEGGIYPADKGFLEGLRSICDERDIILIFDEIQCGMGRTGEVYAYMHYGVRPDILTTAKALGGGVPVGAFTMTEKVASSSLEAGDHGSTYGGNPLALAGVIASLSIQKSRDIIGHVKKMTPYLEKKLDELVASKSCVLGRRGMGFMQGLILSEDKPVGEVVKAALDKGLVVISAEGNVLRMLPPLIIDESNIDRMYEILNTVL